MSTDTPALVGRDEELLRIEAFLDHVVDGSSALWIEGEPGIGKTSLWRHGLVRAADRGIRVLSCRPTEADSVLSFLGLQDLLDGVDDEPLSTLSLPQRAALEIALLRKEPADHVPDWRAIDLGVLETFRALSGDGPLVVAVDDLQWLDLATARVLGFAARRLGSASIGIFLTTRAVGTDTPELDLSEIPEERVTHVHLMPLAPDEIDRIVRERTGLTLRPPTMDALRTLAAGNPFFAIEIARASIEGESPPTGQRLPIPKSLKEDVLRHRLRNLTERTREVLFVASALSKPTVGLLHAAVGGASLAPELDLATGAGLIHVRGDDVSFTHPLFGSAIYAEESRDHRHRLHRRLADIVEDPEQRARHMALGAEAPDTAAVAALREAAGRARDRGSPHSAAELCELAAGLVPAGDPEAALRVRIDESDYLIEEGRYDSAVDVLERTLADATGAARGEVLFRLSRAWFPIDPARATQAIEAALRRAGSVAELGSPRTVPLLPDVIEVLVTAGALDDAEHMVAWLRSPASATTSSVSSGSIDRCRALISAARGEIADALRALDLALSEGEHAPAFDLARTLLVSGRIRRRARQKRLARADLEGAFEMFRDLDAEAWANVALGELRKISGRKPSASALTPAEVRVARLAAAGRTNREIADALFASIRTVEGHLSHVYAKLAVRSRAELVLFFDESGDDAHT
jgi:DNA-binding CsgD family transcriptional regulator